MVFKKFLFFLILANLYLGCSLPETQPRVETPIKPVIIADTFAYPIGKKDTATQLNGSDEWYNAQDFGENDHLGEDWNKSTGGNTDCGEPVYVVANGLITYAGNSGPGWGNVVIVEHRLVDGKKIESLYGHLQDILRSSGEVKKREQIGKVGNANGRYPCHLHFEIREESCLMWGQAGPGYSKVREGWLDPSDFIDARR